MSASPCRLSANARLLLFRTPSTPVLGAGGSWRAHVPMCSIAQQRLISNNTTAQVVPTPATSLCEGYICRAAVLDALPLRLDFLMPASPWQGSGLRGTYPAA